MRVLVYATKPDGYYWKAPSWSDGKGFSMISGLELDMEGADLEALAEHVKAGYWLRYEPVEMPKLVADKVEKKK